MLRKALSAIVIVFMLISALNIPVNSLAYNPQFKIKKFNDYLLVIPNYLELESFIKLPSRRYSSLNIGGLESLKVNFLDNVRFMFKHVKPQPTTTLIDVLDDIGVSTVREKYGLTGEGVTVGIVDTGVDFSIPSLGLDKVARDGSGKPLLLDTDMLGFTITDFNVEEVNGILQVKDKEFYVYFPLGYVGKIKLHSNWVAPPVKSVSGNYKFGLFVQIALQTNLWLDAELSVAYFAPVVLVDSKEPGIYDTVFVDVSTTWFILKNFLYAIGYIDSPASLRLYDFSFKDEKPLRYGDEIAYIDENYDGYPEFSIGVIAGYVYDVFGLIGKEKPLYEIIEKRAWEPAGTGIYPGLDPKGRYVDFFYDPIGHGTSVASIIAGKRANYRMFYYRGNIKYLKLVETEGIAPNAKIAAATGLYVGSVITAQLWLSGYNYVYPWNWTYTGKPRVDIISNSWGLIDWETLSAYGIKRFAPGKDPISSYEDKIVSTGVLVVHAAGNSGPGYGTVLIGGSSSEAITVGATTIFQREIRNWEYGLLMPKGTKGEVVSWSSRGPTFEETIKPNIVAPGAYALVPTSALGGVGNGEYAIDVFGGTSMSTPIVSGASALIIEELRREGKTWNPKLVKKALYSSAEDLGYDPFTQGWGKLNVNKAVEILRNNMLINNTEITLTRDNNYSVTLEIKDPYIVDAYAEELKQIGEEFVGETSVSEYYSYLEIPLNVDADIVEVYVNHSLKSLSEYMHRGGYGIENLAVAILGLWNDTNNNGKVDIDEEFLLINQDYSSSNILRLTASISNIEKYCGKLIVGIRNTFPKDLGEVKVYAKYFKWVKTDNINVEILSRNVYAKNTIIRISCNPVDIGNGAYEAKVILTNINGKRTSIPVAVFVEEDVHKTKQTLKTAKETLIYKQNIMYEGFGWLSGTSRGDWRIYRVKIDSKYEGAVIEASILNTDSYSNIQTLAFNSSGYFIGGVVSAQYPILGILESSAPPYSTFGRKTVFAVGNDNSEIILALTPTLIEKPLTAEVTVYPVDVNIFYYRGDEGVLTIYSKYPLGIVEVVAVRKSLGVVKRLFVINHRGGLIVKPIIIEPDMDYKIILRDIANTVYAGIAYNVDFTPIIDFAEIPFSIENYTKFYSYIKTINALYSN